MVQRSKSKKKIKPTEKSITNGSTSLLLPSIPVDERSSKLKKKKKKKKRSREAQNMSFESTKEEESARTLLEMKGAPAKPASELPSSISQTSKSGQFRAVNSQSTNVEDPGSFPQGHSDEQEHHQANGESIYRLQSSHNIAPSQLIDSPPLTPGLRQQSLPSGTRDEENYEPSQSLSDSQMSKDTNRPNYHEASNVPTPPYGSNLESPVLGLHSTSVPSYATFHEPQSAPRSAQSEKQKRKKNTKSRREKDAGLPSRTDHTIIVIDPILTGYDQGRDELAAPSNQENGASPSTPPVYTTKRKRDHADSPEVDAAGPSPKRSKVSQVESVKQKSQSGGPFTDEEILQLRNFMDRYREEHCVTEEALNERIQETSRTNRDHFWTEVTDVLPYRTKQSIYKVCRRRFHNFGVRGKWTAEEDEELKAAQLEKPNQWKAIGARIHRMPEDCRDRWRNYLKCGDARNQDMWKVDEERALERAVRECKEAMRADREQLRRQGKLALDDVDDQEDKLLNWTIISEKMKGARSRLQCQYKWPKMKKRNEEQMRQSLEKQRRIAMGLDPIEQPKRTWRLKRAEGNYTKMLPGDKYEFLVA